MAGAATTSPERAPALGPAVASGPFGGAPSRPDAGSVLSRWFGTWNSVDANRLAAALAYYTVLSLAPFLILVVAVGSWWVGADATRQYLSTQIADLVGREGGQLVDRLVSSRPVPSSLDTWGAWMGVAITAVGATATFAQLQDALDRIFGNVDRPALWEFLRARALSFCLVLGTGLLLAASLVLSAALTMLVDRGVESTSIRVGAMVNELVSFVVTAIAFAALLRVLPDRPPRGRQLWIGAGVSAALFAGGKYLIGWYVTRFAMGSAYGAAGTVVILMLWIYFSAATFLAGAVLASVVSPHRARTPTGAQAAILSAGRLGRGGRVAR